MQHHGHQGCPFFYFFLPQIHRLSHFVLNTVEEHANQAAVEHWMSGCSSAGLVPGHSQPAEESLTAAWLRTNAQLLTHFE